MKEFMFFIRKQGNSQETLSPEKHQEFLKSCESYIKTLKKDGELVSAQPIEWKGEILSREGKEWRNAPYNEAKEVIGGYYHIRAGDMEEAIAIARQNPEFQYSPGTRIEVRPVTMKEETTGIVYPNM